MAELTPKDEIEAIKKENLTGRQLRMARRLAQKQGLDARSDLDAVRLLRRMGIDPFVSLESKRSSVTEELAKNLPAKGDALNKGAPARVDNDERALNIRKIQQNLVRRRRRRIFATLARVFAFVFLPTIIAQYYFSQMATPMFSSYSKFVVQKATPAASSGGRAAAAALFANAPESISVQNYLESRVVMLKLDEEYGFRSLFDHEDIDPLQRLDPDASVESAHDLYSKRVSISYDPTEGVISLEVSTPDPVASFEISNILREYAEVHVRGMTSRSEIDKIARAEQNLADAEKMLSAAQEDVFRLQAEKGVFSGENEITLLLSQNTAMREERDLLEIEIEELMSNPRFNQARVETNERKIERLDRRIEENRRLLTEGSENAGALNRIQAELAAAERNLALREGMVASAFEALEGARLQSQEASIYINRAVNPIISDDHTYPKVFENTLLAFLIFGGIYLLISLTFSILREQMTT